jgi:hypothetical protein
MSGGVGLRENEPKFEGESREREREREFALKALVFGGFPARG